MENGCVFCDQSKIKNIFAENEDFYLVATPGQITDGGYVLLIPREHTSCMGALAPERATALLGLEIEIYKALSLEYCRFSSNPYPITVFEHGIVGQTIEHAHLHLLPAVIDLTPRIRTDFSVAEIDELQRTANLRKLYCKYPEPYLFWTTPGGKSMVCWNPPAPPQYLRTVAAELLGRPERGNWRNMDPELDKRLCAETVTRLKPYFL